MTGKALISFDWECTSSRLSDRKTANLWILSGLWCSFSLLLVRYTSTTAFCFYLFIFTAVRLLFARNISKTASIFLQYCCLFVRFSQSSRYCLKSSQAKQSHWSVSVLFIAFQYPWVLILLFHIIMYYQHIIWIHLFTTWECAVSSLLRNSMHHRTSGAAPRNWIICSLNTLMAACR